MQGNGSIPDADNASRNKTLAAAKFASLLSNGNRHQNGVISKPNDDDEIIGNDPKLPSTAERFRRVGLRARFAKRIEKIADERMTVKQIFNRYVENSTLHGFRYIFMQTFFIRRLLWTMLTVTMAAIFLSELKNSIELYCQYPFTTTSTMEYIPKLKFPAISICNFNSLHEPRVTTNDSKRFYRSAIIPKEYDTGSDIDGRQLQQILKRSSNSISDIFQSCEWKSQSTAKTGTPNLCFASNFTSSFNLHGQTCYTFNGKDTGNPLTLDETGLNLALKLEFDLKSNKSVQSLQEVGLKVIVHDQDETPLQQAGFVISPGFHTLVELKVRKTENLPGPYATRCGESNLEFYNHYRQSKCFLEKLTEEIHSKCNCKSLYMEGLTIHKDLKLCSLNQTTDCVLPVVDAFDRKTNIDCPVDCHSTSYGTSLSYARFITDSYNRSDSPINTKSGYIKQLQSKMKQADLEKYIEENVIVAQFFYQEMKEENVQQEPSYDHFKLIGDIGGQLGLLLGASVLTLVEFVDLFFFTLYHQLLRLHRRKRRESESLRP